MRVFFSVGEASGDAYAAEILKQLQPEALSFLRHKLAEFQHDAATATVEELLELLKSDALGLDSLDIAELVMAFEEEYGVNVPDDLKMGIKARQDLMNHITAHIVGDARMTDISFQAVGGRRLREAGARIVADSSHWGALGIVEALKVYPRVLGGFYRAKREIKRGRPGLFVPIDFGYVNVLLARHAKNWGWKVLYFIPPGSWRKDKQGEDLPKITDAIVTPFPWSADMLNEMGADAHFFGHPLKEMVARVPDVEERDGFAVLPGSRAHEIEQHVPVIAEAVKRLQGPIRIAVAPNIDEQKLRHAWIKWSDHEPIYSHSVYEVLKASRSGVVCSGTATLEAALCGCPCVVLYRGGKVMELEYRLRRPKFEYMSLPNILLDRPLLKELIQWDATPDALRAELELLHADGQRRSEVLSAFQELSDALGATDCLERTAELAKTLV
ncbi:MAG: hypothetical protein IH945_03930 [Armatimonadetes bacterium]|nr:hypothetical protein [Armatimonadota bacterium]